MLEQAINKIHEEMEKNKDNEYIQVIGAYLASYLRENPSAAANIMTEGKTIEGSLSAMRKVAEKKKKGNFAVLTPSEGYKAVFEYYGIWKGGEEPAAVTYAQEVQPPKKTSGFNVSLNDLLD